jgi:hypothetical protein
VGGDASDGRETDLKYDSGEHRLRDRSRDCGDERPEPRPQAGEHDEHADDQERPHGGGPAAVDRTGAREHGGAGGRPRDRDRDPVASAQQQGRGCDRQAQDE